jgi:hypothetical protein
MTKLDETARVKLIAAWALLAPVGAMVLVVALGGGAGANQYIVDSHAIGPRPDSVFDGLASDVPATPGVDGSVGTEKKSTIDVPITGTTDGKPQPPSAAGNTSGIPGTVLAAYQRAANGLAVSMPGCGITWPLLAGIGKVESSHAAGGRVDSTGRTNGEILGPVLDGRPGMAAIADTDHGRWDGNAQWDRAVGPMQFIPGSWAAFGADGNGDGVADPHNVFDASKTAGDYLCSGGANLRDPQGLVKAVLRYNHSMDYVSTVLRWMQTYSDGTTTIPDTPGTITPSADDRGNVDQGKDPGDSPTPTPTPTLTPTQAPTVLPTVPTAGTPTPITKPGKPTNTPPWPPKTTQHPSSPPWSLPPETRPPATPTTPSDPSTPTPTPTPTLTLTPTPTPSETPVTETPTAGTPGEDPANP